MQVIALLIDTNNVSNTGFDGIVASDSADITISNNVVDTIGDTVLSGNGIRTQNLTGTNLVDLNTVSNTMGNGIFGSGTAGLTISNNTVDNTGQDGIEAAGSAGAQILANLIGTVTGNIGLDGVHVNGSDNANVDGNTINDTGRHGVLVNPS